MNFVRTACKLYFPTTVCAQIINNVSVPKWFSQSSRPFHLSNLNDMTKSPTAQTSSNRKYSSVFDTVPHFPWSAPPTWLQGPQQDPQSQVSGGGGGGTLTSNQAKQGLAPGIYFWFFPYIFSRGLCLLVKLSVQLTMDPDPLTRSTWFVRLFRDSS
jgi:hypothetical protein